ncbi:hypothetical protein HER21_47535, partial [Pseudomonas sp. BGM005]|nr:hypothetical protein [Pseudomonas sp. BG5]
RSHPVAIPATYFRRSSSQAYEGSRRQRKTDAHILDDPIGDRRRTREPVKMETLERFDFYDAAKRSFAIVRTADPGPYGCFIFKK